MIFPAMSFVAQVAGFRDIPVIGWVSDSPQFGDKMTHNTLIRVLPPINVIGKPTHIILIEKYINISLIQIDNI